LAASVNTMLIAALGIRRLEPSRALRLRLGALPALSVRSLLRGSTHTRPTAPFMVAPQWAWRRAAGGGN